MNRKERRSLGERGPKQEHPTVELAYIHPGEVSAAFMSSVVRLRDYELMRTQSLLGIRERRSRSGSIAKARNELTTVFMSGDTEWLWFVDADMGFPRDALHKLLAAADPVNRPLMGGLCFSLQAHGFDDETNAEFFGHIPTLSVWKHREEDDVIVAFNTIVKYPKDTVCQVDTTGAACILIHRSVIEKMHAVYGNSWFTQIKHPERDDMFGEDTSFFLRATEMGIPLHVHTGVRTSHDKGGIFLTEQTYEQQELLKETLLERAGDQSE